MISGALGLGVFPGSKNLFTQRRSDTHPTGLFPIQDHPRHRCKVRIKFII